MNEMIQAKTQQFYINGAWVAPLAPQTPHRLINPATEACTVELAMGGVADVERAVNAAHAAFASFSLSPVAERLRLLERLLALYQARYQEMADLMTLEMGAPRDYSYAVQNASGQAHIEEAIRVLRDYAFVREMPDGCRVAREAVGVCAFITPWNWPTNQVTIKVAPALAAGCSIVLKPSELSPLSALLFADMVHEAGFPAGVFNLINGSGAAVGAALAAHPLVDCVSFTGSTRAGVLVAQAAAPSVKRVSQELGGKSPNIILPDADLAQAVKHGVEFCFANAGQSCDAPTRMLIAREHYQAALEIAKKVAANTKVADPQQAGEHIGPVISQTQYDKIQGYIQIGIDEGAQLLAGGLGRPDGLSQGYFVKPTIFAQVHNKMRIAQEEIFGPVLVMIPYDSIEEAIQVANDTPYGLAACVSGRDPVLLRQVIRRLRAGSISVNGQYMGFSSPFGGYKQSGNGREGGVFGLEEFLETKTVAWAGYDG